MFQKMLIAGLIAAALPAVAMAQPADQGCVRSNHDNRVEGTVLGAVAGGLIGGALGHGTGAAVGVVGGAVAGNAIAGANNHPCPEGYYRPGPPPPPPPAYGYGPPPPPAYGYAPPPPGYGHGPPPQAFWNGAPSDIHERIEFMQGRLQDAARSGRLSPPQAQRAFDELHRIRDSIHSLAYRDHGLTPDDRAYVQAELDHLGASVHWMEHTGY
jgi:hypothetical protein